MPVRFAGRRQTARQARLQAAEKQKGAKSPKKSAEKDAAAKPKASPTRRVKSAPHSSAAHRTKLPPVDYDQALRKLVRASEILERSTDMEKDVEENLEKIQQRLEPFKEDKN
jgi:hypothetical protein